MLEFAGPVSWGYLAWVVCNMRVKCRFVLLDDMFSIEKANFKIFRVSPACH